MTKKRSKKAKKAPDLPREHLIHKAIKWKEMLLGGSVGSLREVAQKEGITRARVTQIMNLLKLPPDIQEFLEGLDDPQEILKYSESRIRRLQSQTGLTSLEDLLEYTKNTVDSAT